MIRLLPNMYLSQLLTHQRFNCGSITNESLVGHSLPLSMLFYYLAGLVAIVSTFSNSEEMSRVLTYMYLTQLWSTNDSIVVDFLW